MKSLTKTILASALLAAAVTGAHAEVSNYTNSIVQNSSEVWTLNFNGREPVEMTVRGDGDTDLDVKVHDNNGFEIASATGSTDRETVRFTPARNGEFKVTVINLGTVYNAYRLTVRTGSDTTASRASRTPNVLNTSN